MVSSLRRAVILPRNDPHDWNSWDNYRSVHERRLSEHPFVVSYHDSLRFEMADDRGPFRLAGFVECSNGILLLVTKRFDTNYDKVTFTTPFHGTLP